MILDELTDRILRSAIEVHRVLGPGLLENAYRVCLVRQLQLDGLAVRAEVPIGITYKDLFVPTIYRADLLVEDAVLLELKAVERFLPIHEAQVNTYLRYSRMRVGLLINFNVRMLKNGIRRVTR
jgi:GxxExxY protein